MPEFCKTAVLPTHTPALLEEAVRQAVRLLRSGEAVALPTETVYGLAVNAFDPAAVQQLFRIKGRPAHNPIIVHVADRAMARRCVAAWPDTAETLARSFWPGPLTLVLPRHSDLPPAVTAGGDTVGIRCPAHPIFQAVIRACGFPLAAPSANLSTQTSPTRVEHVQRSLAGRVALVLDGGPCSVGIESTVLDLTASPPCVLRPGMVHEEALAALLGATQPALGPPSASPPKSPGLLPKHYAPHTPVRVLAWTDEEDLRRQINELGAPADNLEASPHGPKHNVCIVAHSVIPTEGTYARVSVVPHEPEAYARALYAELHACDDLAAAWIILEAVPHAPDWKGIADRLRRAAT